MHTESKQCTHPFILTCFKAAISEHALHDRWLTADQLRLYMLQKYSIEDAAQFNLALMIRVVNKVLPLMSSAPNILEIQGGQKVQVYRHSFQNRPETSLFLLCHHQIEIRSCPPFTVESVIMGARLCIDKAFSRQSE